MRSCTLFVDGGSRGNPGPSAGGVVILDADGDILIERGVFIGHGTNNVAEYKALLAGLDLVAQLGFESVSIRSDSQLLVRQLQGAYRVKNEKLKGLFSKALRKLGTFAATDIEHVARADNTLADKLVNRALNLKADCDGAM